MRVFRDTTFPAGRLAKALQDFVETSGGELRRARFTLAEQLATFATHTQPNLQVSDLEEINSLRGKEITTLSKLADDEMACLILRGFEGLVLAILSCENALIAPVIFAQLQITLNLTELQPDPTSEKTKPLPIPFIDQKRYAELENIPSSRFDLQKLLKLCHELKICYQNDCVFAVAALTRALLDHVPPIFDKTSFAEVANSYPGGKSFKDLMQHLDTSARKIGDMHLHVQIRPHEVLPTRTQVNFTHELDVLLGEVVRLLR